MFQEIGECMRKATDGNIVYFHVLLCLPLFFFFGTPSDPLFFFFLVTVGLRHLANTCQKKSIQDGRGKFGKCVDTAMGNLRE